MTIKGLTELKTYFEHGDRPTEQQFEFLIDSLSVSTVSQQTGIEAYNQLVSDTAIKEIQSISGNLELTSNPQITHGVNGQKLILLGLNEIDTITINNGNGIELTRPFTISLSSTICLIYIKSRFKWIELYRYDTVSDGTQLTVNDEGSLISNEVTSINFIGNTVTASETTPGQIDVSIIGISPDYVSHFGTSDGETNASVNNILTVNRNISTPTSEGVPFKLGDWIVPTSQETIQSSPLVISTIEEFSILNNINNTFRVRVYDADNSTVLADHAVTLINNSDSTLNNIRIQILNFAEDTNQYKARVIITIDINSIISNGGRFYIELVNNTITDGLFTHLQGPIFYDTNSNISTISSLTINETLGFTSVKQISGISYYGIGSQFTIDADNINYLNDSTYPNTFVQISSSEYGISQLNLTSSDLTSWSNIHDNINSSFNKLDCAITQTNYFNQSTTTNIQARTIDWIDNTWFDSINKNILIDTFIDNTTSIYQDFRNENNRIQSNLTTSWNSGADLTFTDSGNGLQIKNNQLIYPVDDFTIYSPTPTSQFNYTTLTGDRFFYSDFSHNSISHSNGRFLFSNHNITELNVTNNDFILEISLDGVDWFNLNILYPGGVISDTDGCRINNGVYNLDLNNQIDFTFGTGKFTDISSGNGWGIWYKLTYTDNLNGRNLYIGSIELVTWV